jgi:diguanylate cyclase (GGDEF)-like protein
MKLQLKIFIYISFLFAVAIGNAALTFLIEHYGEEKLYWVDHTNEVIIESNKFLSFMKDAETGQRGFLITENSSYLAPYYSGTTGAKTQLQIIKRLTTDNDDQQQRIEKIQDLMVQEFEELDTTISLTESGKKTEAVEIVLASSGKRIMDDIRLILSAFITDERLLLEQRKGDLKANRAQVNTVILLEIVLFIFLGIITVSFLKRQLFAPLNLLLRSTEKMASGEKIDITDIVAKDEMGFLLTTFFKMNETVYNKTEKLDYQAHHDTLTGLENRTEVSLNIDTGIKEARESGTKLACLFIDLNKFKQLNDTLGHDAGDIALVETALRLKSAVRSDDDVFRLGGDEFLVLLKSITDISEVKLIVKHINKAFETPKMIQGKEVTISLSIGIAIAPDDTVNDADILKFSDLAMYQAKQDEESNFAFFNKQMLKRSND